MLFEIYEEMRNKYGFQEGNTPEGIEKVRKKIIDLINKGLDNSLIEAYPMDRSGVHNWCLIGFRNKQTKKESGNPTAQVQQILNDAEKDGWTVNTYIKMEK